ncbi:MAG: phosphotransferase [Phycisphaeraceae bacterium]|nr:phosphotransferase [Phycisphaeraceae bacterium]
MTQRSSRDQHLPPRPGLAGADDNHPYRFPIQSEGPADRPLGAALAPVLEEACHGRLHDLHWFRTDWQRGGAMTGYARYHHEDGTDISVVVKLPIPPRELTWLRRLQPHGHVAPQLIQSGDSLGGYDFAWVVMERLPHGPLGTSWGGKEFDLLVHAVGQFYHASFAYPLEGTPKRVDWEAAYDKARKNVGLHSLPNDQQWNKALKKVHKKFKEWAKIWEERPIDGWVHGDLHLRNAMTRDPAPAGPAVLLDFAETRPGHWVEDAVYFEHLYWAQKERLAGRKLCRLIAHQRKDLGLPVDPDWAQLADVRRGLLAVTTPAVLAAEGDPRHLQAVLEVLEIHAG